MSTEPTFRTRRAIVSAEKAGLPKAKEALIGLAHGIADDIDDVARRIDRLETLAGMMGSDDG